VTAQASVSLRRMVPFASSAATVPMQAQVEVAAGHTHNTILMMQHKRSMVPMTVIVAATKEPRPFREQASGKPPLFISARQEKSSQLGRLQLGTLQHNLFEAQALCCIFDLSGSQSPSMFVCCSPRVTRQLTLDLPILEQRVYSSTGTWPDYLVNRVLTKNERPHPKKIVRKSRNSCRLNSGGVGAYGQLTRGSNGLSPETNTNAQRIIFVSHL